MPEHIILNKGRSITAYRNNRNNSMKRLPKILKDSKWTSISNFQSPIKKQISLKKSIKFSLNKYHQYMKNLNKRKNNNERPMSLYLINKRINNREDIGNECLSKDNSNYFLLNKKKDFSDIFSSNSNSNSFSNRTLFSSKNNSKQRINSLNIGGSTSPINNNNNSYNNDNSNTLWSNNRNKYLTLSLNLKNSKFFNKTKYINNTKNINMKKYIKPKSLLSSYNIQLENSKNNLLYDTLNEMSKKLKSNNKENNNNNLNNDKDKYQMEKAQFFDILPMILNHIKQKETIESLYEEYNKYISKPNKNKRIYKNDKMKNPIIKYIFLENILNNLKHKVQFVNAQTKEQMEKYVIKVIGEEYNKLNINITNSKEKDFISYGFEYFPKFRNIFEKIKSIKNKGQQTLSKKKESIFFIGEKKIKENNDFVYKNNNFRIWSTKKILIKTGFYNPQKKSKFIKRFDDKKIAEKDLKNEIKSIISNFSSKNENSINKDSISDKNEKRDKNINNINEKLNKKDKKSFKKIQENFVNESEDSFMKSLKPKYVKINLNKINIKGNSQNDNNKIDYSTDRMNNTPQALENLGQENISNNISLIKENNKMNIKGKDKNITKFGNNLILKKSKKDEKNLNNNLEKNKVNNNENKEIEEENKENDEENKESDDENNEGNNEDKEEDKDKETDQIDNNIDSEKNEEDKDISLTKEEDIQNFKKARRINRKSMKGLKVKKKRENSLRNFMENNELNEVIKSRNNIIKNKDNPVINEQKRQSLSHSHDKSQNSNSSKEENNRTITSSESESNEEREREIEIENPENRNENKEIKEEKKQKEEEKDDDVVMVSSLSESNDGLEELKEIKSLMKTKAKKDIFFEDKNKNIYKRRGGIFIPSANILNGLIKNQEKTELNNKMKKIYDKIYKKRKKDEFKKKRKKNYLYSFADVNLNDIKSIEKRKKMHLQRIKEDINYKIKQGKYHFDELDNFDIFNKAMNNIKLNKFINDKRRINQYVHYLEKYFQMFYNDLIDREKQKREEDRINKFLFHLHYDVRVMIPYAKSELGKHCKSIDYNKEVNLSELKS